MIIDWKGKISARPWMRTLTEGFTQLYTRVLGTTIVVPAAPRSISALASRSTAFSIVASRNTSISVLASEA